MARPSQLEGRMLAILDSARARCAPSAALRATLLVGTVAVALPFGALRLAAQTPSGGPDWAPPGDLQAAAAALGGSSDNGVVDEKGPVEVVQAVRPQVDVVRGDLADVDLVDRMSVYEHRNRLYLAALDRRDMLYRTAADSIAQHFAALGQDARAALQALQALQLDAALCPRSGGEQVLHARFDFDAGAVARALAAMELPPDSAQLAADWHLQIRHPGGVGDILLSPDGGGWLAGHIEHAAIGEPGAAAKPVELALVALA